jgi:transketolase
MSREDITAECARLEERVFSVKRRFLAMYKQANAGHIGSSLSCAEILVFLQFAWMREKDRFVLSKGHAVAALYSVLAELNLLGQIEIDSFYAEGTLLPALPPFNAFEEIPFATGSLGYGLSLSAGMALAARFQHQDRRFFCVTSDGELDEGSVWEAALFIAHHKLKSVVWVVDRNRIQAIGRTEDVLALEPLAEKFRAFGFHVIGADGHDFASLLAARAECERAVETSERPVVVIADTVKGNGISCFRDTVDSHYLPLSDARYAEALAEMTQAHHAALNGYRHAD